MPHLQPGQQIRVKTSKGLVKGTIATNPVKGHYDQKTDSYYIDFGKDIVKFIGSEHIQEARLIKVVSELAFKRATKKFNILNESTLTPQDFRDIRKFIREEIAAIFFDLFRKRTT